MKGVCRLCGRPATDRHHIFGGPWRPKSEKYGLVVPLCRECHQEAHFGPRSKEIMEKLHKDGELRFRREHPDLDFRAIFGREYLDGEEEDGGAIDLDEPLEDLIDDLRRWDKVG